MYYNVLQRITIELPLYVNRMTTECQIKAEVKVEVELPAEHSFIDNIYPLVYSLMR